MVYSQIPWLEYIEQIRALAERVGYTKILAAGTSAYAIYKVVYALCLSPLRKVPGPLFARLTDMRSIIFSVTGYQAHKAIEEYEKYGDVYVYKPEAVSISNPEDLRLVLGSHDFTKTSLYDKLDLLGEIVTIAARDPQFAKIRRRQIGPYFSHSYLAKMEQNILKYGCLALKERWSRLIAASSDSKGKIEINYHTEFMHTTADVTSKLIFGKEFGALNNDDPIVETWRDNTLIFKSVVTFLPIFKYYPLRLLLQPVERIYNDFVNNAGTRIAERKELLAGLKKNGELDKKPIDLLQGFIDATDPESKIKMTPNEVHAETLLMLIAGSDTSANSLTWTMHILMLYPECYKKAVDEVRSAFDKDHTITFKEARTKLPYLEACIYESLRVIPVTGGQFPRTAPPEGVTLSSGHFIPGGTEISINFYGANMHRNYWASPHLFDPTRFLDNDEAKKNVFTFSAGVRACPGKHLSWMEMFTILANLLKDFDLRLPDDYTLRGPNVIDEGTGYPKLMDSLFLATRCPANADRDCRLIVAECR